VNCLDLRCARGHRQSKTAVVCKTIQYFARRISGGCPLVLALLEETACFLTFVQVVNEAYAIARSDDFFRDFAREERDFAFKPFEFANAGIVPFENSAGRKKLRQNRDQFFLVSFRSLAERLQDEPVSVAINDERRE